MKKRYQTVALPKDLIGMLKIQAKQHRISLVLYTEMALRRWIEGVSGPTIEYLSKDAYKPSERRSNSL